MQFCMATFLTGGGCPPVMNQFISICMQARLHFYHVYQSLYLEHELLESVKQHKPMQQSFVTLHLWG